MTSLHASKFYANLEVSMQETRTTVKKEDCKNCGEPHNNLYKFCGPTCESEFYE